MPGSTLVGAARSSRLRAVRGTRTNLLRWGTANVRTQKVGDIEIHKLVEIGSLALEPESLFSNVTRDIIDANRPWLGDRLIEPGSHRLMIGYHSYVVRTPRRTILVDTCNGNQKRRPSMPAWHMLDTPYLERLAEFGLKPDDIDVVLCTHLHADHVGWNTRLVDGRWVPTFPRARYIISKIDFDFFSAKKRADPAALVNRGSWEDSVLPIIEHGLAVMVDSARPLADDLAEMLSVEPAPGHTPGNMNLHIRAGGRHACICGDVIHHAIQCAEPTLSNPADTDPALAYRTRLSLLETYADTDTLILTGHFPSPTAGHIVSHQGAFRFAFAD